MSNIIGLLKIVHGIRIDSMEQYLIFVQRAIEIEQNNITKEIELKTSQMDHNDKRYHTQFHQDQIENLYQEHPRFLYSSITISVFS